MNSLVDLIHPDSRERIFRALETAFIDRSTFDEQVLGQNQVGAIPLVPFQSQSVCQ